MKDAIKHITAAALLFVFVIGAPALVTAQKKNTGAAAAPSFGNANSITSQDMRDWLTFIASDELEGRDTPSKGLDIAARYIASHLANWGIQPGAGEGTYFQRFPLTKTKIDAAGTKLQINGEDFN